MWCIHICPTLVPVNYVEGKVLISVPRGTRKSQVAGRGRGVSWTYSFVFKSRIKISCLVCSLPIIILHALSNNPFLAKNLDSQWTDRQGYMSKNGMPQHESRQYFFSLSPHPSDWVSLDWNRGTKGDKKPKQLKFHWRKPHKEFKTEPTTHSLCAL